MLLECFSVRPDGSDGGALLQHCTSRTRTRTIKPAIRLSPTHESKSHRREPQSRKMNNPGRKRQRGRPRLSCRTEAQEEKEQPQDKKEEEAEVQEEQAQEEEEEEEQEQMEKDDPNWIPSKRERLPLFSRKLFINLFLVLSIYFVFFCLTQKLNSQQSLWSVSIMT